MMSCAMQKNWQNNPMTQLTLIYQDQYNYRLGLLGALHPFDGQKFKRVTEALVEDKLSWVCPDEAFPMERIDEHLSEVMRHRVRMKNGILNALEVPRIPLISYSFLDKRILTPMRWAVAGTMLAAKLALENGGCNWSLSGGYHHASRDNMEGFCIFNDIAITYRELIQRGSLQEKDKILIIDVDAHHGNGNAISFMDNPNATLLDVYNTAVYPTSQSSRDRVDISVPLPPGTSGDLYLERLQQALSQLRSEYRLVFVVAGTDVLSVDQLGGLNLTVKDVAQREQMIIETLDQLGVPTVVTGGGGYSKDSATAITAAIRRVVEQSALSSAKLEI